MAPKLIIVLLVLGAATGSFPQTSEKLPLDHWAYEAISSLVTRGFFLSLVHTSKPFTRIEVAREVARLAATEASNGRQSAAYVGYLVGLLEREFQPEIDYLGSLAPGKEPRYLNLEVFPRGIGSTKPNPRKHQRLIALGEVGARLGKKAFVYERFQVDTDGQEDPDYRGSYEKFGLTGSADLAYLNVAFPWFEFSIGRDHFLWGPGSQYGLLISPNSPSFDMFSFRLQFWRFTFTSFTASLAKQEVPGLGRINRYLSAHRLVLKPNPRLEFGVAEAILYGGSGRRLDLLFSNPFLFYFAAESEIDEENNLLWSMDATYYTPFNIRLYMELLIDDISLDKKSPDKVAYRLGADLADGFGLAGWDIRLAYMRVDNWVYNFGYNTSWNRYLNYESLIGHPLGPDADRVSVQNSFYLGRGVRLGLDVSVTRRGEGRVTTPTPAPAGQNFGYRQEKFPSGVVETTRSVRFGVQIRTSPRWYASALLSYESIANEAHRLGDQMQRVSLRVQLGYRFRRYFVLPE